MIAAGDRGRTARRIAVRALRAGTVLALLAWVLLPFYFLLLVALTSRADSLRTPPRWIPAMDFGSFRKILDSAFSSAPPSNPSDLIVPGMQNSAVVAVCVAALNIVIASTAGYAFARFRFPGSRTVPGLMLGSQLVPVFALVVPFYVMLHSLGLTDTRAGIVIAHLGFTVPFSVWMMRAYFNGIPVEVDRAAMIDGCTRWQVFARVVLPLARPGIISVGLFSFMVSWNDFLFALVLNSRTDAMLIQPAISGLYNVREQSFGIMAAGTLLAALPTMLLALVSQRFLVRGLTSGVGKV
ncbi:carbohydrate ABC transporter permease [Actinomadura luteofluorescens]|uniref:Multiple sugar transport system permease protein n=1 Tax=Actinomadura luteofluorescens TaxID=46163 RepID=A0A7Y9JID0_9ACTN|nr:carbohydrate ABC transporter permease [Actinomadura luteofluorescens]NYD49701.1 multiple sugar transport system permease protein [Actinomadura luteofluorescens]